MNINKLVNKLNGLEWIDYRDHKLDAKQGNSRNKSKKLGKIMSRKVRRFLNNSRNW